MERQEPITFGLAPEWGSLPWKIWRGGVRKANELIVAWKRYYFYNILFLVFSWFSGLLNLSPNNTCSLLPREQQLTSIFFYFYIPFLEAGKNVFISSGRSGSRDIVIGKDSLFGVEMVQCFCTVLNNSDSEHPYLFLILGSKAFGFNHAVWC